MRGDFVTVVMQGDFGKPMPALVIQADAFGQHATVTVLPVTSTLVAARTHIVEGAVGMVEMALTELKKTGLVELDEERRANMVSNLLVVLCSDRATQPVVNTGSLY